MLSFESLLLVIFFSIPDDTSGPRVINNIAAFCTPDSFASLAKTYHLSFSDNQDFIMSTT